MAELIYLDISELVANPVRTGIQRVEREAIRHWTGPARLAPCCIDAEGRVIRLADEVLPVLCAEDERSNDAQKALRNNLDRLTEAGIPTPDRCVTRLLNLELFFAASRANAHLRLAKVGAKIFWYIHDFIPFLRPDVFPQGSARQCMHFLRGLRAATRVAFNSEQTRDDYVTRIVRGRLDIDYGPVLTPGADSLRLERQEFAATKTDFVAIGTLEPRKNPMALLTAFQLLWNAGIEARLIVCGRLAADAEEVHSFFQRNASNPSLVFIDQPTDEALRVVLRKARAVIMPSEIEGFGVPPYESVHSGIPAIASARLPSAKLLTSGTILLPRMDATAIASAVKTLLDDATASQLWQQAAHGQMTTWASFGRELSDWAQSA